MKYTIIDNNAKTTLLYVHGYGADHTSWEGIKNEKLNFNIVAIDYPKDKIYNAQEVADKIEEIIPKIYGPIVIMGHSLGGAIVAHLKNRFKIKKVIYASALTPILAQNKALKILTKDYKGKELLTSAIASSLKLIGKSNIAQFLNPPKELERFAKENIINIDYLTGQLNEDYKIKSKKSIAFIGNEDKFFNYKLFKEFMDDNQIKCYIIAQAGHNPFDDQPKQVVNILNSEIRFKKRWRKKIMRG